jgi:hypothetical protein
VFLTSMTLVVAAQLIFISAGQNQSRGGHDQVRSCSTRWCKSYGDFEAVKQLTWKSAGRVRRHHGPVGLRQDHDAAHAGRA